jgi:DNA-directed DNA polymerase III PolC
MTAYTHLHVHSYYTLLGATPSPEALARRAADEGLTHLALTDTNALYGAVAFDRACRAAGIRPILGMAVAVAWPGDLVLPEEAESPPNAQTGILVLLARDHAGYRSLCRLSALIQGSGDREVRASRGLPLEALHAHAGGLLCLTGGRRGLVEARLRAGHAHLAHRFIGRLCGIYGPAQTYLSLELQTAADREVADRLVRKADLIGLRTVAVQPVYTLKPHDRARLRLLAAIDRNCNLADVPPAALPDGGAEAVSVHWLDAAAMAKRFAPYPEAIACTQEIAARCGPALPEPRLHWPAVALDPGETPETALRADAAAGACRRYPTPLTIEIRRRLDRELATILDEGYAPLFLVVADIVRYAREHDIPVSTRGSVANSLVAYLLGITTVDPIAHELLFERFLSPGRSDPPDIDLDFCSRRRDEILAYVRRTYGEDRVALVGAMSTLRLRSAARETAKAYSLQAGQIKALLAHLPRWHPRHGDNRTIEEVVAEMDDPWLREVTTAAYGITGFPHHLSIHAAGLIITPGPLTDLVPVQMAPKGFLTTQYGHEDAAAVGLPKLDLLGIRALTVLADAAGQVRDQPGHGDPHFRLGEIPLDDPETGALLAQGDTVGVFQCDSMGARRTLRQLQARSLRDLAVANAFFKPGPATGGQADVFVRRYRGQAETTYLHPALEPILASTKGVLIFQEQVLRVATEVAGLAWVEADHIRRGMSKMRAGEMRRLRADFIDGCRRPPPDGPGMAEQQAEQLWEQVAAFSGYGFNQGHATAYADVSYRSAYMKAHWPAAFFWARLRNYGGYHHPAVYMAEAMRLGVEVRPPHVNHSRAEVVLAWEDEQPVLWLGLGLVRDLRRRAVAQLVRVRRTGPFSDLRDLLLRVDLQRKEIQHLIQGGALDGLGANRPAMLAEATSVNRAGTARQMAFDFAAPYAPPAPLATRMAWERRLLGYPLNALRDAFTHLGERCSEAVSLEELASIRRPGEIIGVRLPGWHSRGYALWDGASWTWARPESGASSPPTWAPARFQGQWRFDRWGLGWFTVHRWHPCDL